MPKAQETYDELLKTLIAPGLRAIGFKGSGQNYRLPSDDHWAMLGFQKSTSSDASHVRFTANVLVVSRSAWDAARAGSPHLPERPTATTFWGTHVWQKRIGALLPGGEDMWWDVEAGADEAELGRDRMGGAGLRASGHAASDVVLRQSGDTRTLAQTSGAAG